MNAITDTPSSLAWRRLGAALPTPRAILCISAHWYVAGTSVTGNPAPKTIHDFGGFPRALYEVVYPAPGDAALAGRIAALLAAAQAEVRADWGLDHGTWSVLCHMRPDADVPVLQLSIDHRLPPAGHLALGRALQPLREEGVLILGSGNITHNLRDALSGGGATPPWAASFDAAVARAVEGHDTDALVGAPGTAAGRLAHPTLDHYLPLLYVVGAATAADAVSFPVTGFDFGSLSMRSVLLG